MDFSSRQAEQRYAALVGVAAGSVVGLDFDGTLAPIVEDPEQAAIHPEAHDVLVEVGRQVRAVAVITGRPVRQVLELGRLAELGERLAEVGCALHCFGQYGNERWSAADPEVRSPEPPPGLATYLEALPTVLAEHDAADAYVEEKGLAVAVHTRRLPDPSGAFARLVPVLTDLAHAHDLGVEPGRNVVEVRAEGMHKGIAVETLVAELAAEGFLFGGDDLGDVEAFDALTTLGSQGLPVLRVCSASEEEQALLERSDVVVEGPDGVLALLRALAADAAGVADPDHDVQMARP